VASSTFLPAAPQGTILAERNRLTMALKDPTAWFDDLSVYIEDDELIEQAKALEPTLVHGGSRIAGAIWISLVSAAGGAFGGFTCGDAVRSSWLVFIPYLAGGVVLLSVLKPVSTRLVGPTLAWQAVLAFFWSFLLAMIAVLSGAIATVWISDTAAIGGGLFIGLLYGSLGPGFIRSEDAWILSALPLGGFASWSATGLQRAFYATTSPPWAEAFVGLMAASVFIVPMAVLMAMLSSRSAGLAKMATLYLHNDNFTTKAIEYLDQAIALSPRSADLHNLRGIAYSKCGDGERADADFRKVSELSPRSAEAHMNLGVDFMRRGDFARSIEALKHAATINPKLATVYSNLGTAYQKNGQLDAAIDSYTRAIALRRKYPIAFSNRAYSHFLKGDHDRAIADAEHALALEPGLAMAHANLGHALAAKGDTVLAARSYRRALASNPDHEVEEETLAALEKLGVPAQDDDEDADD
jgi:tetratricopeptide (TPR) repeat protein